MNNNEDMIDILCVTTKLCIGGVQTYLINSVEPLLSKGVRLNFAVQTDEPQVFDEYVRSLGCRIFHVHSLGESRLKFMRDIRLILKKNPDIKVVHSHQNFANLYSLIAAKGLAKTISHAHSNYKPKSLFNALLKECFKFVLPCIADGYWACSEDSAKWLYGAHSESKKCRVIKNSVSTSKFKFDLDSRSRIRRAFGIESKFVWIHVGTLSPAKNHKFLIDLFAASLKDNKNQHLLICGDGVLRSEIEEQISFLNLREHITMLGNCMNPQDFLSSADLYVFPSLFEGFPLSTVEAQANGIPGVVSQAVPSKCMINPNIIRVESLSIPSYLRAIRDVLNIQFPRELGKKYVDESGFSIETESDVIARSYYEVLKG